MKISPFICLVRIALGKVSPDSFEACDEAQWEKIFDTAKRQAVLGLLYKSMMMLPDEKKPSPKIKVKIAVIAEKIEALNKKLTDCTLTLYKTFHDLGMQTCILKGQGLGMYYDDPSLRQCGDIDIWVGGNRKDTLNLLKDRWKINDIFYHHVDVEVFKKSPEVEVHFTPTWMNNPFINRKLQNYFKSQQGLQLERMDDALGYPTPDTPFNLVFNMVHIYRHLLFEGVGLRQLVDYYYILMHSTAQQRQDAYRLICEFRMKRFASAVAYVLKDCFDIDDEYLFVKPSKKYGEEFLREIYRGGNFGKFDFRNKSISKSSAIKRFAKRMQRLVAFVFLYPSEVLWAPFFKVGQFILIPRRLK